MRPSLLRRTMDAIRGGRARYFFIKISNLWQKQGARRRARGTAAGGRAGTPRAFARRGRLCVQVPWSAGRQHRCGAPRSARRRAHYFLTGISNLRQGWWARCRAGGGGRAAGVPTISYQGFSICGKNRGHAAVRGELQPGGGRGRPGPLPGAAAFASNGWHTGAAAPLRRTPDAARLA